MKSYLQIGPRRTLELHAAPLQQDRRHQVLDEPGVNGRGEDVQNMMGVRRHQWLDHEQFGIALRTEVKKVNISKSFHV